jgi:hypothetical protein
MSISTGSFRCLRVSIPDAVTSFQVPADVTYIQIKNVGLLNSMRFNADGDDTHYRTLVPGGESPSMRVLPGTTIYTDGVLGATTAEIILWD